MDGWVVGTAVACVVVSVVPAVLQRLGGHAFGARIAEELRDLPLGPDVPVGAAAGVAPQDDDPHALIEHQPVGRGAGAPPEADANEAIWQKRLYAARAEHLDTIRAVAGKWRDAFVGLLGLFGAVLALAGTSAFADVPEDGRRPLFLAVMLTLVLALNATFYTGWAATGGTWSGWARLREAKNLREEQNAHAGRSLYRLRLGLVWGGLALVGGVVALGIAMASQLPR